MRAQSERPASLTATIVDDLAFDWSRLSSEPNLSRERSLELLSAVDRIPGSAWPAAAPERGRAAASLLIAIGAASERLDFRHRRLAEVADQLLHRLLTALPNWAPSSEADLSTLFAAWEHLPSSRRNPLTSGLVEGLQPAALLQLEALAEQALTRFNPEVSSLLSLMQRDASQAARPRELRLLVARLRAQRGDLEGALELLAHESPACAVCAQTAASLLDAAGRDDEANAWLVRATVGEDPAGVRQFMFDRLWERRDRQGALEQQASLLEASHQGQHWLALRSFLEEQAPELLPRAKELLRQRAPDAYMAILLEEGPDEEIALCAQSKAFSAERLWEIGAVLQPRLPAEAAKLYERALQMQGVAAVTRLDMTAFLERVRDITPFFEGLGRPTKAHRIARDAAAVSKCGAALKREYEHFFGSKL